MAAWRKFWIVKGKFYKAKRIVFGGNIEGFQEKMQYTKQTNKQTKQNKTKQNEVGRFFLLFLKEEGKQRVHWFLSDFGGER